MQEMFDNIYLLLAEVKVNQTVWNWQEWICWQS